MDLEKTPIWPFYNMYIHFLSRLKPMSANLRVLSYNIQNPWFVSVEQGSCGPTSRDILHIRSLLFHINMKIPNV